VLATALIAGLAACVPEPSAGQARRDPSPSFAGARTTQVDRGGGHWSADGVTVDVPDGAVTANVANVTVGDRIGAADSGIATELFGAPVRIDSAAAFGAPVTIRWDVSALAPEAAAAAALVRWDDDARVWVPDPGQPALDDGSLSVQVRSGGVVTWATLALADASPPIQPPAQERRPMCRDAALPDWVTAVADPPAGRPGASLDVCFEATAAGGLAARNADLSGAAHLLELDGATFEWTKRDGQPELLWQIAAEALDDEDSALVPPGGTLDLGLLRPADGEPYRARAVADARTAALDLLAGLSARASFGQVRSPAYEAFVASMLACVDQPTAEAPDVDALAATLTACARALADPSSGEAQRFAAAASAAGDADAGAAERAQGDRAVAALIRLAADGAVTESAAVRGEALDAAAAAPLGGSRWTVYGDAEPAPLTAWTPTCSDVEADADALFDTLATQPALAGASSGRLQEEEGWTEAVSQATAPLSECDADHRTSLMARLPSLWPSVETAESAADAIAGLGLSLLSCDDLFALIAPLATGFHELGGVTASGTGRVACGWSSEKGRAITDPDLGSHVQLWVSREAADAADVQRRRVEAEKAELGGVQDSGALDAADGFVVGAYVPSGLELEAWVPGYRVVITATSADDPAQWRMPEGVSAVEAITAALTAG
jgi:hypothetical protein